MRFVATCKQDCPAPLNAEVASAPREKAPESHAQPAYSYYCSELRSHVGGDLKLRFVVGASPKERKMGAGNARFDNCDLPIMKSRRMVLNRGWKWQEDLESALEGNMYQSV
jgi:hypothetical protein